MPAGVPLPWRSEAPNTRFQANTEEKQGAINVRIVFGVRVDGGM